MATDAAPRTPLTDEQVAARKHLNLSETAAYLGVDRNTVALYLDRGDLEFTTLNGRRVVLTAPLLAKFRREVAG